MMMMIACSVAMVIASMYLVMMSVVVVMGVVVMVVIIDVVVTRRRWRGRHIGDAGRRCHGDARNASEISSSSCSSSSRRDSWHGMPGPASAGRRRADGGGHGGRGQVFAVGKTSGSLDDGVHVTALRGRRTPRVHCGGKKERGKRRKSRKSRKRLTEV